MMMMNRPDYPQPVRSKTGINTAVTDLYPQSGFTQTFYTGSGGTGKEPERKKGNVSVVIITLVCILALLGLLTFAIWSLYAKAAPDVILYQVNTGNSTQYIGGGGIMYPHQQLDISYPVSERVLAVYVKIGDQVSENQSLIKLDPSQLNSQITRAYNEMSAALAYLNTVSQSKNTTAIAQAQQAYDTARNNYNALVAEASTSTLHDGNLISPMAGVVTAININPGDTFAANIPLVTVMDESTIIIHVKVPLSNLGQILRGQNAVITPSALPDRNFTGNVIAIVPQADSQTDTFEVWVEVNNPDGVLLPGMSAFVRIDAGRGRG